MSIDLDILTEISNKTDFGSIPRIIHQTWKSHDLEPGLLALSEEWKKLNPLWAYRLWSDNDNLKFVKDFYPEFLETYISFPYKIQRVDAIRYLILHKFGGVYIDLDFLARKSLEHFLSDASAIVGLEPDTAAKFNNKEYIISNAFIAVTPEHPMMKDMIHSMITYKSTCTHPHMLILDTTGPYALTRVYEKHAKHVITLDERYLFPMDFRQVETWCETRDHKKYLMQTNDSYAVHMFNGSWWKDTLHPISYQSLNNDAIKLGIKNTPRIPKRLHFTWKTQIAPDSCLESINHIRTLHEGWEIHWWTDQEMAEMIHKHACPAWSQAYGRFPTMIQRCDFFRVFIIWLQGGIYLDIDVELKQSFNELDAYVEAFFPCEKRMSAEELKRCGNNPTEFLRIGNYAMGAIPNHPFFKLLLDKMVTLSKQAIKSHNDILETTGPGMITSMYHNLKHTLGNISTGYVTILYPELHAETKCNCGKNNGIAACTIGKFGHHRHMGSWR